MRVVNAIFDYRPLWDTMRKNGVSQNITMVTLEKLCRIVGCTPNDVVRFEE